MSEETHVYAKGDAPSCDRCVFFEADDDEGGFCHRYPPVLLARGTKEIACFIFTEVNAMAWCGEFKAKT